MSTITPTGFHRHNSMGNSTGSLFSSAIGLAITLRKKRSDLFRREFTKQKMITNNTPRLLFRLPMIFLLSCQS